MMDVDHFKRFNDTFGHGKGDEILQELGMLLLEAGRSTDTCYRFGGEEFSILLRETALLGAQEFAERLRRRIEQHFLRTHPQSPVTASFGVAMFLPAMRDATPLVEAADRALYDAKHGGRNRVAAAADGVTTTDEPADAAVARALS
jgi:diguanylate cyclase (GGDEF)-like protein